MSYITLVPAYGRDYKSANEVTSAWLRDEDFQVASIAHGSGYVTREELQRNPQGVSGVNIRYSKLRKVVVLKLGQEVSLFSEADAIPVPATRAVMDYREAEPERKRTKKPSMATLERWSNEGVAKATDGCRVEPDGTCEHGHPSWLVEMGYL